MLNAGLNVVVGVVVSRRVPHAVRGRVSGTINAVAAGANLAGYVLGGVLLTAWSPRLLIGVSALVSVVVAVAFLIPSMIARTAVATID